MKAIRVCDKNMEKIESILNDVQKRTRERNISIGNIMNAIKNVEEFYKIPKKYMTGLVISCDCWADTYPNAYRYTPYSTQFSIEYRKSGWFVYDIRRDITGRTERRYIVTNMEDHTKEAIVKRFSKF